jgi:hypothetical protein
LAGVPSYFCNLRRPQNIYRPRRITGKNVFLMNTDAVAAAF